MNESMLRCKDVKRESKLKWFLNHKNNKCFQGILDLHSNITTSQQMNLMNIKFMKWINTFNGLNTEIKNNDLNTKKKIITLYKNKKKLNQIII